ncbi:hypothetical protein K8R14_00815 [bacterium]|nr:hypothetical protein [bacterium]
MNKKTLKILIIVTVGMILLIGAFLIYSLLQPKALEGELIDTNPYLNDNTEYNLSIEATIETKDSPLYICKSNTIPEYLDSFASKIDNGLQKTSDMNFVTWGKDGEVIVRYDIDTTVLMINLSQYPEAMRFNSIEDFIITYLDPTIKYVDPIIDEGEGFKMYRVNRIIDEQEIKTGSGSSDYFYTEKGYLKTARVLLAQIEKSEFIAPMIEDIALLERYLSSPQYPKMITIDTTGVITSDEFTYETMDVEIEYEKCSINKIEPVLYFVNCNQNFLYYSYEISGVCDVEYEKGLFSVPFVGFMNAIDPEYVKSGE